MQKENKISKCKNGLRYKAHIVYSNEIMFNCINLANSGWQPDLFPSTHHNPLLAARPNQIFSLPKKRPGRRVQFLPIHSLKS